MNALVVDWRETPDGSAWARAIADDTAAWLRAALAWFPASPTVTLFGMGDDAQTASLFPGMAGLDAALAAPGPYLAVDADGCAGAQAWPRRITLVPAAIGRAVHRALLIRGDGKRALLRRALADGDMRRWPVLAAVHAAATPLAVYWAP